MSAPAPLELVLLIGLQAAGKSTFYRDRLAETHAHVSKDLLRNNRNPERRQRALIEQLLGEGRSVVVDNTNAMVSNRAPLIEIGRRHGARVVGYYFPAPAAECAVRNRQREGRARVPDVAVFVTASKLEPPSLTEGFDELCRVAIAPGGGFEVVSFTPDE